jgi:hypothetical protein
MGSEAANPPPLTWSSQYAIVPESRIPRLPGDKIILPPSALEQLLAAAPIVTNESSHPRAYTSTFDPFNPYTYDAERQARAQFQDRQQQLPHPLTFRLVNPDNGRAVYAGIREFSAEDEQVVLSQFLREALGIDPHSENGSAATKDIDGDERMENGVEASAQSNKLPRVTVHAAELPKGTFVRLRPLEAGYNPEDWKALLEEHLRKNFTTLTNGEVLEVPGARKTESFRFLVDEMKPEGNAICIVDTDLEVDIEPLNEEQARETLKRIAEKARVAPGTAEGSSPGGKLDLFNSFTGQVREGDYVDYELPSWDRSRGLEIELSGADSDDAVDLLVSPFGPRQRARPREDEYILADFSERYPKRIRLEATNTELEDAEALWISVYAYKSPDSEAEEASPKPFTIRVSAVDSDKPYTNGTSKPEEETHDPDDVQCKNCLQWVPQGRLFLHENFCLRNNTLCPKGCGQVFQKRSPEWEAHWHCPHDASYGNTPTSKSKHDHFSHNEQTCPSCSKTYPSISLLAQHRTTECPGKLILCRFCHLAVPQEGDPDAPSAEQLLSGLTAHELADGARTTECHLCGRIVRLRELDAHLKHHDLERLSRPAPRICRNVNCGRTLDGASKTGETRANTNGTGNAIGLCGTCFGPLYVSMHDPEGKALKRRIERRYLSQLLTGCGKAWCANEYCKTGRTNKDTSNASLSTKDALPLVKPFVAAAITGAEPLHFCVDESSQKRRAMAEMLSAEPGLTGQGGYALEWCIAALEAEGGDLGKAREWLGNFALQRNSSE